MHSQITLKMPHISYYSQGCEMCPYTENQIKNMEQRLETNVQSCSDCLKSYAEKLNILYALSHSHRERAEVFL